MATSSACRMAVPVGMSGRGDREVVLVVVSRIPLAFGAAQHGVRRLSAGTKMPRGAVLQSWGEGHDGEAMPSSVELDNSSSRKLQRHGQLSSPSLLKGNRCPSSPPPTLNHVEGCRHEDWKEGPRVSGGEWRVRKAVPRDPRPVSEPRFCREQQHFVCGERR